MKKQTFIRNLALAAIVLVSSIIFVSCQKTEVSQTFDDTFNTDNIEKFNELILNAQTLTDLPVEFSQNDFTATELFKNFETEEYINSLEKSLKLSSTEVDLLLQNDITTFSNVIDRISLVKQPESVNEIFAGMDNSSLNKYLLVQKQEIDGLYEDDYYNYIIELQNFMRECVINPLEGYSTLVKNTSALKSASSDNNNKSKATIVIVVLKNKQDMDDKCKEKKDKEKEKKHKGSKGNNGNHNGHD